MRELYFVTCMFLFIPVRLIIAPAFSASESGNLLSAAKLTVNSPELHSTGGRISAVDLELNLLKRLANGGSIIARNLALNTQDITNSGLIYGEAGYQVRVDNLSNSGTLSSPAKIDIAALHDRLDIHNSGNILARQTEVTADSLYGAGTVSGAEWAKVNVGSLGGGQSVTAGEHLELNVARGCLHFVLNAVATRFLHPLPAPPPLRASPCGGGGCLNCQHALTVSAFIWICGSVAWVNEARAYPNKNTSFGAVRPGACYVS